MKVLYLINHAGKAGTEKYVYNLVTEYNRKKADCFFVYSEPGLLLEQMKEQKVPIFRLKMRNPLDFIAAYKLAKICRENEIDVIHAQYPRENYIAILSKLFFSGVKVVYTSHLTIETGFLWKITNWVFTAFNHKIISVCNHGKELLIKNGVHKNKIVVIFNAVEYHENRDRTSTIRQELNLDDEFLIVTLARYHYSKGLPFLVESIKRLKAIAKRPFKLIIVGDGEMWDEVGVKIKLCGLTEKVIRLGFRKDVDNILNGCDLFVNSASCLEALSFAMLEALAKDIPLVATDVGGNSDIVNDLTGCGLIVPYGDVEAMAKAINAMMKNEEMYAKMVKNAALTVKSRFHYGVMLVKTFETYT